MGRLSTSLPLVVLLLALVTPTVARIVRSTRTQCGCTCCVNGACADTSKCSSAARTIGAIVIVLGVCCCIACCVGIYFRQRRNKRLANNQISPLQIAAMQVQPPADGTVQQGIPVQYAPVQYAGDPMAAQYCYPQNGGGGGPVAQAQGPPAVPYDPNQYQYQMPPNQVQQQQPNQGGFYGQIPTQQQQQQQQQQGYPPQQQQAPSGGGGTGYFPQYQMPPGANTMGSGPGQAGQTWGGQPQPGGLNSMNTTLSSVQNYNPYPGVAGPDTSQLQQQQQQQANQQQFQQQPAYQTAGLGWAVQPNRPY